VHVLPSICNISSEFELGKCVIVPLFRFLLLDFRARLTAAVPHWAGMSVEEHTRYLGVSLGPGRKTSSWTDPFAKFLKRASSWGALGLGLFMTLKAYSVYMATVLLFVGQLEDVPEEFDDIEDRACRKLFTGPWKWIAPEVLHNLTRLHFPIELCNARKLAVATKSRVVRSENAGEGGLKIRARAKHIRRQLDNCEDWAKLEWLHTWVHGNIFSRWSEQTIQCRKREMQLVFRQIPQRF